MVLPVEPAVGEMQMTDLLQALGDPIRLSMVRQIARRGEVMCGDMQMEIPKSSLSHHFRVLRTSGVLTTRREGKALINSVRRADIDARFPGLLDAVLKGSET